MGRFTTTLARLSVTAWLLGCLVASGALGAETEPDYIPMEKRKARLLEALRANEQPGDRLLRQMLISAKTVAASDLGLELVTPTSRIPLTIDDTGIVDLSGQLGLVEQMTGFAVLPLGADVTFGIKVTPRLPLTRQLSGEDLRLSVEAMRSMIKEQAGFLAMLAPKIKGIQVHVPLGAHAEVVLANGDTVMLDPDPSGWIQIPLSLAPQSIQLTALPLRYDFLQ